MERRGTPQLPTGAYTGVRLAAWISSNFASATYVESRNKLEVAYDGNRLILNDQKLRTHFPGSGSYPQGATPSKPRSINHLLGPSFVNKADNQQIFTFVEMQPYLEVYLRCSSLANAADTLEPLGHDIIAKIVCKQGVGHIIETDTHENHLVNVRGPITLRYLRFRLTDYKGNMVDLRGTSLSFCIYLDRWLTCLDECGRKVMEETSPPKEEAAAPAPLDAAGAPATTSAAASAPPPGSKNKPKPKPEAPPIASAAPDVVERAAVPVSAPAPVAEPPKPPTEEPEPAPTPAQMRVAWQILRADRFEELRHTMDF